MMESTSLPWNPTSVNFVASTLRNGACDSLAMRRAISVLPQPVGPIMRMFLGCTSILRSSGSRWRRQRLRSAIATARLASACPTMYLSRRSTTSRGLSMSPVTPASSSSSTTPEMGTTASSSSSTAAALLNGANGARTAERCAPPVSVVRAGPRSEPCVSATSPRIITARSCFGTKQQRCVSAAEFETSRHRAT